ncbi:MAG: hypothetical protein H6R19_3321, partial [Proteobacteria bacterium]|nr:hypothetical protein [Pseudomonadota bacterium]
SAGKPELLAVPTSAMRPEAGGIRRQTSDARDDAVWRALGTLRQAKALQATGNYEYVEPNYRRQKMATFAPNDPYYATSQNWHYQQINLPSAMDSILALTAPSQLPIVAVIDDGIVSDHPDLADQIVSGYSFITISSNGDGNTSSPDDPSTSSNSPEWHGTHVAGTIAAIRNNSLYGIGVASVAKLMPLRVFRPGYSYATDYDIIQAIRYASGLSNNSGTYPARKADVINMSLGASGTCTSAYTDVISQARAQNVIVVAAAGNSTTGNQAITVPANCTGVISVGATNSSKTRAYYSNQGSALSLVAPGGGLSTTSDYVYSTLGSFNTSGTRIASFGKMAGTSMAAPHVAGVMALMRYADPALTPAQVDSLLASSQLTDDIGTTGRDNATGYGLINAYKAVTAAISLASSSSTVNGVIVASPTSLDFGSTLTSATLTLSATSSTTETVTSIVSSSSAVTVTASSISTAGLGTYTVSVDRSLLSVGTTNPTLTITTSAQVISVPVTIVKLSTSSSTTASYGGVWVKVTDATTGTVLASKRFNPSSGSYTWSLTGIPAGNVYVTASTDLDNDGVLCESGEACGGYANSSQSIQITGSLSGLSFSIAPTLGTSTASDRLSP